MEPRSRRRRGGAGAAEQAQAQARAEQDAAAADGALQVAGGEAAAHRRRLEQSGVVESLKAALELLFAQPYLAENPFAALAALVRHHSTGYELWGSRAPGAAPPPVPRPLRNELNRGTGSGASVILRAKDTFEWWGLGELVELVDPKAAARIVALVESQHGTQGGQSTEGEYTIRHMLALSGDWVFAHRALGYPGAIELRAEYSVAGPDRETAMEMFVLRVMEDVMRLGWGLEGDARGHEHVVAKFHIEKARKDDMAAVYSEAKKALEREEKGLDLLGRKEKAADQARLAKAKAQAGVPLSLPVSEEWDIHLMRKSRQNFIAEVKAAVNARRRVWVSYYALITDNPAKPAAQRDEDEEAMMASPRSVLSEGTRVTRESEHSWYCRWDKMYTFHFQPRGDIGTDPSAVKARRESLGASPHEALLTSVFFTRHEAEDYLAWFESPVYDDRGNVPDEPTTLNQTFRQRMRARVKEHAVLSDGPAMLKALLKHLSLEPLAAREEADEVLQAIAAILQSGAGEFSALAEEASTLSNVLQILLTPIPALEGDQSEMTETDFAMVDHLRRDRQLVRAKGHFRLFRKRLMSAVSRQEESNIEVAAGSEWVRNLLRQMYDKRQQSLLVTRNTVDLLRQLQVYCDAVALSTADALLDCPEAASVLKTAATAVASINEEKLVPASEAEDLAGDVPFIVRGSWADRAGQAATLLSIEVAKEQRRLGGLRLVPPEIAKEAVYLQYSADTGLADMLPQLISGWALDPFPRNVYMATTRSLQHRMVHFDCFHQNDPQLLVDIKAQTASLVPWRENDMYEVYGEDFAGSTDADALQLYTVEFEGVFLLGSELALSCATAMVFDLGESASVLLTGGNSFEGQYSWERCTGICGSAVLGGTVLGSLGDDLGGCLAGGRLYLAQDSCFAGPSRAEAQDFFVYEAVDQVFDLLETGSPVLLTGVGSGRESDELVSLRTLRVTEDGEVSDDSDAFESALGKLLAEAVLEVGAIRLEGYILHKDAYLPFTKHVQFHFGEPNFLTLATHEWPRHMHLHERLYISDPYSDTHEYVSKLFARCHGAHRLRPNEMYDRGWLVKRIRDEVSDPQETSQLFLSVALLNSASLSGFVPPTIRGPDYESEEEAEPEPESEVQYFPNGLPSDSTSTIPYNQAQPQPQPQQLQAEQMQQPVAPPPPARDPPVTATFQEGPMGIKWNLPEGGEPLVLGFVAPGMAADEAGLVAGMELQSLNGETVDELRSQGLDTDAILAKMGPRPLILTLQAPAPPPPPAPAPGSALAQPAHGPSTTMYDSMRGGFGASALADSEGSDSKASEPEPEPEREPKPEAKPEPEPEEEVQPLEELSCLAECCRFFRSPTPLLRCIRTNMRACCQLLREAEAGDQVLAANLLHEPLIRQFRASAEFLRHFLRPDVGRATHFVGIRPRMIHMLDEVEKWATDRALADSGSADAEASAALDGQAVPVAQLEELETSLALLEMAAAQNMRACCTATSGQIKRVLQTMEQLERAASGAA